LHDSRYLGAVPAERRVAAYNYSVSYAWAMALSETAYQQNEAYAGLIAQHAPLGELAPWDPGYQNLFASLPDGTLRYLTSMRHTVNFGRSDELMGMARTSYLLEVLTGEDRDPRQSYTGSFDHRGLLTDVERQMFEAVIDLGFAYMARCDDRTVPSGPNAGKPWGDPLVRDP
jgi:hypothetical protein